MNKIYRNTTFLAIIACLLWSTAFAGIKTGLKYTTPFQFAGIRFILSGLFILPFCGNILRSFKTIWRFKKQVILIGMFQTFLLYTFFYTGISRVPAAITAMVIGASPLFITIIAHLMTNYDKINSKKIFAILLGISGVIIIALSRNKYSYTGKTEIWGIVILIISNFAGGIGNVLISKNKKEISPVLLNAAQITFGGICLLIISIPFEGLHFGIKPLPYYISLLWLSFLSAAAFSIWFVLLHRPGVKVSDLNIWKFLIPIFGAILAWIIIPDENPQFISVIGMIIISLSLVLLNLKFKDPIIKNL